MFVVLFGFAGLALDAGHIYLVHRNAQNATDAAALAAGKRLSGGQWSGPPATGSSDPSVRTAHDVAASNGFTTVWNAVCDRTILGSPRAGLSQFTTTWYDTTVPCGSTTGFNTSVTVYSPPQTLTPNCSTTPYNCLQVVITQQIQNYLMGVLGQPVTTVSALASVFSEPTAAVLSVPPPIALYLYEPGPATCNQLNQACFDETKVPVRSGLSCKGTANCPTFWSRNGSRALIAGINGNLVPAGDTVAVESNGDMVLQDGRSTTFCDPFAGPCSAGTLTGLKGFAINNAGAPPAKLFCSSSNPAVIIPVACTTAGPGAAPLGPVIGTEVGFASQTWTPQVDTTGLPYCGALVLNGDAVARSVTAGLPGCLPPTTEPYTIQPGRYDYIVVNHGSYEFEAGLYVITSTAPINTSLAGVLANGIDHSLEGAADWDLCQPVAGCTLTAGIWIGHGGGPFVAGAPQVPGTCPTPGPTFAGGGDPVQITGNGVTFSFQGPRSGGFVSTHEVDFIGLVAPGLGQQRRTAGVPILFDLENDSFIHLDADGDDLSSRFKGITFQYSAAKGGGVEVNPGLAGGGASAAAVGQVWAYSFTTFGTAGFAVDFSQGLGTATLPVFTSARQEEPEILTRSVLQPGPTAGSQQLLVEYNDEWKLDAYDAWVKINNGSPIYFSQGLWNPFPPAGQPLPPNPNGSPPGSLPSDSNPAPPALTGQDLLNNYTKGTDALGKPDWKMTYADTSTFEVNGDWIWGHEQQLAGASSGTNNATLRYTFPIPAGTAVTITLFMNDGDSCGDFVTATWIFNNIGSPGGGRLATGAVHLEQ